MTQIQVLQGIAKSTRAIEKETASKPVTWASGSLWLGHQVLRGIGTGLGTILVYAIVAVIIIKSDGLSWLRDAFGLRFSSSAVAGGNAGDSQPAPVAPRDDEP